MSATGEGAASGFTLFEMLVVLAILGLIGGIVYPGLLRGMEAQGFRAAAGSVATALREARARALSAGVPVLVRAADGGRTIDVSGFAAAPLPAGLMVATAPARGLRFFPDGSASAGTISLASPSRRVTYGVQPATGLFGVLPQ